MTEPKETHTTPDCPFLGIIHDPSTALAYATPSNFCFHCKTPTIPVFTHQEAYCLTTLHTECPVFTQPEGKAFPDMIRYIPERKPVPAARLLKSIFLIVGILLVAFLIWKAVEFVNNRQISYPTPASFPTLMVSPVAPTVKPVESDTPIPPTSTIPAPTAIPSPTGMNFPAQLHQLEAPINVDGKQFIIHRVLSGEVLSTLAKKYVTSAEAIRSINYHLPDRIWAGSLLVISPNLLGADPSLPEFSPYQVVDVKIKIEDLAAKLKVVATELKYYNRVSDSDFVQLGDWLIVPYSK